jgi:hypothetical protein
MKLQRGPAANKESRSGKKASYRFLQGCRGISHWLRRPMLYPLSYEASPVSLPD